MDSVDPSNPSNHAHFTETIPIPTEDSILFTVSTVDTYFSKAPPSAVPAVPPQSLFVLSRGNGTWRGSTPDGMHTLEGRRVLFSAPVAITGRGILSAKMKDNKKGHSITSLKTGETEESMEIQSTSNQIQVRIRAQVQTEAQAQSDKQSSINRFIPQSNANDKENKTSGSFSSFSPFPVLQLLDPESEQGIKLATVTLRFCIIVMITILFIWIKQCCC